MCNKQISSIFKNIGYEIEIAQNGLEAGDSVEQKEFDVVFMDLLMPEMDGFQAAQKIRENGHTLPIVALSAGRIALVKASIIGSILGNLLVVLGLSLLLGGLKNGNQRFNRKFHHRKLWVNSLLCSENCGTVDVEVMQNVRRL